MIKDDSRIGHETSSDKASGAPKENAFFLSYLLSRHLIEGEWRNGNNPRRKKNKLFSSDN